MSPNKSNALFFGLGALTHEAYDVLDQSFNIIGVINDGDESNLIDKDLLCFEYQSITSKALEAHKITQVIIALQHVDHSNLLERIIYLSSLGLEIKTLNLKSTPEYNTSKKFTINNLSFSDLIQIPVPKFNQNLLNQFTNQTILITGAAGSIGSELAKMLLNFKLKSLVLLDNAESALYELQQELIENGVPNIIYTIGDIRNYERMESVFKTHRPNLIFHAAAYKHVPLMEEHPIEAILTNILGTKHIADLAQKHGANQFILISSDKAVNPTNVMGATKRVGELYIEHLNVLGNTRYKTARFGNVLASNGSVIPLFQKQIENGGPVTLTDKEIERYFITLQGACELVLECTVLKENGSIYVFEMGKPIRIYDLAKLLIRLNKAQHKEEIKIKMIGSRPGEKIKEELASVEEKLRQTEHKLIKVSQARTQNIDSLDQKISELCLKSHELSNQELVARIKAIVPEYIPNNPNYKMIAPKPKLS
ncbi:FlaA1/EpsC-like NDP-sugar epimerase [Flavobacteriaceae bacterium MAR_2010_72]|nr:FlaA1/EpsC-like NDP-sugar epimerase [Flavobacteriaceae bacterium MAR_2010_72]TVZ59633.1 FlaA1/EpsC-like NDP-sugar epimerase [Flavobacteriaceae bacterium MAR_2010_105]